MVDMCKELHFDENALTLFIFITNKCNYSCVYCCEKLLLGNTFLDLKKMYDFILFLYHKYDFKKYYLDIYGGEPTLHPDLYDFCKKIYELDKHIYLEMFTNFSKSIDFYNKLLALNVKLIITYHYT
jgi:MoaA/NifB/PqqE/SkfB family radical SAM enzyme